MAADAIQIGAVYIEDDIGSDHTADRFYITFQGGAPGTELTRVVLNGDMNAPGMSLTDIFFDTAESGFGIDHAFPFQVE